MDIQNSHNRGGGSSETREKGNDVFLSCSEQDNRPGFADGLYNSLHQAGIHVIRDLEERTLGQDTGQRLIQVIRHSKIAIPILSKNYPSSKCCLQELVQIVECHKTMGQIIMPVFLNVTPSVVKNISRGYGEAITKHGQTDLDPNILREWEEALIHVVAIPGLEIDSLRTHASLIDVLVANVLRALNRYLVGIEHHVERVMELLNVESSDVRVVGICGKGGTGKTTIAKLIYKRMCRLFDGWSFLESVGENEERQVDLEIFDLQGATRRRINSFEEGTKLIRTKILHKKSLIILDDVGASFRLKQILGNRDRLGFGSRIMITTRAQQALAELEQSQIYVVEVMEIREALQLFYTHAFRERPAPPDFATLSQEIVSIIDRLPLTIEVVGSYLYSKTKEQWNRTLHKLQKVSEVQQKLSVIIEELPFEQRLIFLDIACFFIEEDESVACYLWSDRGSASGSVLKVLVDLSIVKIENGKLWMHDQLRDLGRDLELGKRSRLWSHREALDVLMDKNGTESVEGVLLKFGSRPKDSFEPAHFARTSNIRFLRLDQAKLEGNFERCLSNLRWLHWQGRPSQLRAENLDLKELVILDLSWSKVTAKWNGWIQIQKAKKLKVLNLTGCDKLKRIPDLSHFTCLERLILERCMSLNRINPSIKSLQRLVSLNLRFCTELNKLPHELGSLISLEEILIDETAIQEIPAFISHLQKLRRFSACNCLSLIQLPESISHVKSLEVLTLNGTKITKLSLSKEVGVLQYLSISNCRSILNLPTSLGTLASLIELDLSSTVIDELPNTVNELSLLRVLKIDSTFVRELPCAIWTLKRLEELHASGCRSLGGEIPRDIEMLSALRVLKLGYSRICGLPDNISKLPNLQTLDLLHCDQLCRVPKLPSSLISLFVSSKLMDRIPVINSLVKLRELFLADGFQELVLPVQDQIEAKGCTYLQLGRLTKLKKLQLSALKIRQVVGLQRLVKLRKLSLCCINFEELPPLPPGLFSLSLRHYKSQTKWPDLSHLVLLSEFELVDCTVTEVPGLGKFKSLRVFRISHCNLQQVDELENLIFLATLNVSNCQSLKRLPEKLKKLKDIKIEDCPEIYFESVDSHEEPSSSTTEAESSFEAKSSEPANTKRSPSKDGKRTHEGNEGRIDGRRSIGKIDLSSGKKIGEGSNGTIVVEGRHEDRPAAVKCVGQVHRHVADNEINILKKTGPYKNIVRFYGEERDRDFVYLALELCTCSLYDLFQAYSNSSNKPRPLTKNKKINNPRSPDGPASKKYTESKLASDGNTVRDVDLRWVVGHRSTSLLKLMRDVVFGLEQLHGLEIIHLDLNPTNILITQNPFGAKLSGMGTSIYLPDGQSSSGYHATSCGTKGWQAPELFHDEGGQTQAMDLFSLGCVLFFCITCGRHLFGESNASTNPDLFLVEDMPEAHDLISRLLRKDPKSRPRASEVLHHPFFWSSKRRLTFLHDVSEKIKSEDEKGNSDFMKNLEVTVQPIFKGRWDKIIDPKIMVHLRRFATYDGRRVKSLLRAVRNKVNHHQEAPEEVEKIHGRFPDGLDAYFAKKFPRLLIESYTVAYEVCKNDPHLEEYFLFGELK